MKSFKCSWKLSLVVANANCQRRDRVIRAGTPPVVALMLLHEGVLVSGRGARRVDTPLAAAIAVSTAVDSHLLLGYTRAKHLERLDDDEPPDDGVSGGHGVHDITCHSLGVEETLRRNVVVGRTQQRRRSHKLHGEGVVLGVRPSAEQYVCTASKQKQNLENVQI